MKKGELKRRDDFIFSYIIDCIADDEDKDFDKKTDKEKLEYLAEKFKSEYWHKYNRRVFDNDVIAGFASYIPGLPNCFNVDYETHKIIELAERQGTLEKDATETRQFQFVDGFYNYIAKKTIKLMKKHGIEIN